MYLDDWQHPTCLDVKAITTVHPKVTYVSSSPYHINLRGRDFDYCYKLRQEATDRRDAGLAESVRRRQFMGASNS